MALTALLAVALGSVLPGSGPGCRPNGTFEALNNDVRISASISGQGALAVLIPSLGRGPQDFDHLAGVLVERGHSVIRFEPRWFGGSEGPEEADLFDLAGDVVAVVDAACPGARFSVVGHAFGNRVARAVATASPDRIDTVVLLAAGGRSQIPPAISTAIAQSASQGLLPDDVRLAALRLAFFAPGNDPESWLTGWSPRAAELQSRATRSTERESWWAGGTSPMLVIQPLLDPVAPPENAISLRTEFPGRVTVITLPRASHAMLPEQPEAISTAISLWLGGERSGETLQSTVEQRIVGR